jgi:hypothetical protein
VVVRNEEVARTLRPTIMIVHPEKCFYIIELSEDKLQIPDLEIEVEYQMKETIEEFNTWF